MKDKVNCCYRRSPQQVERVFDDNDKNVSVSLMNSCMLVSIGMHTFTKESQEKTVICARATVV